MNRHWRLAFIFCGTLLLCFAGGGARLGIAQISSEQAATMADAAPSNLPPDSFSGMFGIGALDEDVFVSLALRINFDRDFWGVGFQLPLRLRVIDKDPKNDRDFAGALRREDWDEVGDFFRVLRYVYVGQRDKKGPFYVRAGELSELTIGHGTIMHRYFNGIDQNRWHTGVNAAVNFGAFGVEAMVGDITDPYVAGVRATVRPLMLILGSTALGHAQYAHEGPGTGADADGEALAEAGSGSGSGSDAGAESGVSSFASKLVLGTTLMVDSRAPIALKTELSDPADVDSAPVTAMDDKGVPIVTRERALSIVGVDVGYELIDTSIFDVTPYVDLNKISIVDQGWGLHMGVLWNLSLPVLIDTLVVDLRTEYRRVSHDYVGPYFDTTYEIERYQLLSRGGGEAAVPKLRALCGPELETCSQGSASGRNGVFFELLAGLPNFVFIGGEYLDYDGGQADGSLRLSLEVPALEIFKLRAFYYRVNISGLDDLFELDDRSAIMASVEIPMYAVLSLQARWWRVWQPAPGAEDGFEAVDDWSIGVGFSLEI
ncbi:MAG: hypothetical protein IPK13_01705 [Deltaproteobacteria bacterium]|nr:hypothetical protein [Deltaproteobacteria bacterium]